MSQSSPDIAALVSSRICHDLISPIGAIDNGMELLTMSGISGGPEFDLISQSVGHANARIRFFRVAFGLASDQQILTSSEISSILKDLSASGRILYQWHGDAGGLRHLLRPAFLAVMCLETALPLGGSIDIHVDASRWQIRAVASRLSLEPHLAAHLDQDAPPAQPPITPAQVQFVLLPQTVAALGRRLTCQIDTTTAQIEF